MDRLVLLYPVALVESLSSDLEAFDEREFTLEMHEFWRGKQKELGKKGWLFPTFPKEYGGGGKSLLYLHAPMERYVELAEESENQTAKIAFRRIAETMAEA